MKLTAAISAATLAALLGYYRVNVCITILSKIYFYFTAGIVDTMLKKREEQRLIKIENGVICC